MNLVCCRDEFAEKAREFVSTQPTCWAYCTCSSLLHGTVAWLEGNGALRDESDDSSVAATFYIYYNDSYSLPQVGFTLVDLECISNLGRYVPLLAIVGNSNASGDVAERVPLLSYSFSQELGMSLWVVHPCDTRSLLSCAVLDGVCGDILTVFLKVVGPYVNLPEGLSLQL